MRIHYNPATGPQKCISPSGIKVPSGLSTNYCSDAWLPGLFTDVDNAQVESVFGICCISSTHHSFSYHHDGGFCLHRP